MAFVAWTFPRGCYFQYFFISPGDIFTGIRNLDREGPRVRSGNPFAFIEKTLEADNPGSGLVVDPRKLGFEDIPLFQAIAA